MLKRLWKRKKEGMITVEVPFAMLLFMMVVVLAMAAVHSVTTRTFVNSDMNGLLQSVRMHGYAPAAQIDGVAHIIADSRGYDVDDVRDSLYVSRVNERGELVGNHNSLNGYVHGEVDPNDRVERGSGHYILVELRYETDDDWWANTSAILGVESNMRHINYSRRIGSEYYNPDAEWTGGDPIGGVPSD